jgi:hypothetical protein
MNDYGRKLFYVNRPELQTQDAFNETCRTDEQSIVLGCFIDHRGIFVYDVKDTRLAGIHEVTSAHEMLHAAHARLNAKERKRIDGLLTNFYASITDQRIKDTIELYRANDPSVVPNELHSILGTEVRDLTPELETYYARYFVNRKQVVTFSEQYESVFTSLKARIVDIEAQLVALKAEIEQSENSLRTQQATLESEKARLDSLAAQNQYQAYNAAVPGYNRKINSYNAEIANYKQILQTYNALVEEHNDLALEQNDLYKSIDSKYETL